MSIYVELLERVEQEGEFSETEKTKAEASPEPRQSRKQKKKETSKELASDRAIDVELPRIEQRWDDILAGQTVTGREQEPVQDQSGQPASNDKDGGIHPSSETWFDSTPADEVALEQGADKLDTAARAGNYFVHNMGDSTGGDRVIRGKEHEPAPTVLPTRILIPLRKFKSMGMVTPDMEHKGIVEEYRHLKRILLRNIQRGGEGMGTGTAVTSALPEEGKTFTALNLAMSFSLEKSRTVLLVDADLERGGASSFLEARNEKGLKDYLEDPSMNVSDIVYDTDLPNLKVIPVGRKQGATAELFSSDRMEDLVKEVTHSDAYQLVIFDSSPVLVSSAANILSGLVDQTLVVVRANQTPGHMIREVEETLVDSKKIGFVLNSVPFSEKKHNIYYAENDAPA